MQYSLEIKRKVQYRWHNTDCIDEELLNNAVGL